MSLNSKLNILLIEDNAGDANLITIYLKESSIKYELTHKDTFFDGVDWIKNNDVDITLLDLSLPDSSGFKTLSNFLDKFPMMPVLVLTGVNNEIVGNQAVKAGAQDFLVKGQFDGKLLGRAIRYSLQRFKTQVKLEETAKNLAISEKRYVEAQEMAHFGNWEMDIVSNEMKWTDEIYRIFGFHPSSINPTLSDYLNYVHMEDKTEVEAFFETANKDGKLHKIEHRIVIDGRNIKYVACQAKVYYEEINGKILLVGAIQDITERKLSEQLIIEKNLSRKASMIKEEALADLSFHIRTPLSSIINLLYLLDNAEATLQQKEYIDGLKTSVDDLSIMVNNMLNFSLLVSDHIAVEVEEFHFRNFLQGINKVVQIKADKSDIQLRFDIDEAIPEKLIADHDKITQVLYNLIDNAIKNTGERGRLTINVTNRTQHEDGATHLCFSIKNTGAGINKAKIRELLEAEKLLEVYTDDPEEQYKPLLSMAIATKLIKTLDGQLDIRSNEGEGMSFEIAIPVKAVRRTPVLAGEKPEMPLKILLVEDHFLNQIATKKVLTTWSNYITVDIAENGLIGVEKYREHGYDLILMDIQMPVMNGIDAALKIREKSNVPIIALTANASKQEADRCFEIGINDYLSKPFKPEDLHAKIMNLLVTVSN